MLSQSFPPSLPPPVSLVTRELPVTGCSATSQPAGRSLWCTPGPAAGHSGGRPWASPRAPVHVLGALPLPSGPCEPPQGSWGWPSMRGLRHVQQPKGSQKPGSGRPSLRQLCRVFGQLDGMFCKESPPWIPELRFQEGGRKGCWLQGAGKKLKKSNVGLEAPLPAWSTQSQDGGELQSGPGPGGRTGRRVEAAEWCQIVDRAKLVKSDPEDSLGSRRGLAQDSALRMLSSQNKDSATTPILQIGQLGSRGAGILPRWAQSWAGSRVPDLKLALLTVQAVPILAPCPRHTRPGQ